MDKLIDYLDTGLFLYHRLIRKISAHIGKEKIIKSVCLQHAGLYLWCLLNHQYCIFIPT